MSNYSENTIRTKLYKELDTLELEFVYETNEAVFFAAEKDGLIYIYDQRNNIFGKEKTRAIELNKSEIYSLSNGKKEQIL